jgi:hypothetical protein
MPVAVVVDQKAARLAQADQAAAETGLTQALLALLAQQTQAAAVVAVVIHRVLLAPAAAAQAAPASSFSRSTSDEDVPTTRY